jgi:integrase
MQVSPDSQRFGSANIFGPAELAPGLFKGWCRVSVDRNEVVTAVPGTRAGGAARRNKDNVNARVLQPALRRADELRQGRGLPPLPPSVTVHTLRRTYVSLMLAAGADLRWVQSQVGHEDAKMTLDVYTQVLQRKDRDPVHGSVRLPHG